MLLFKRDVFGHFYFIKWLLTFIVGVFTYPFIRIFNKITLEGMENLEKYGDTNVLFVSNHQTYFADAITLYHVFSRTKMAFANNLNHPFYLLTPRMNSFYIAAEETMRSGVFPKLLAYAGAIQTQRTWRNKDQSVNRQVRFTDITNIGVALDAGWVITFPQGTTKPHAPVRRGIVHIIKKYKPIIIPLVIDGFSDIFPKKGIFPKKWGSNLSVRFKEELHINPSDDAEIILQQIMDAIEQTPPKKPE
ncbi:MAG: 1-acyl-sn-glycerol-3-phosphate acyltransferase [candidate division Zixibacteria bacterium]|nr:1-acyl-sn-glycerol-3-phosphate acyltransferase [candidate division Zixibacteria bacterium]